MKWTGILFSVLILTATQLMAVEPPQKQLGPTDQSGEVRSPDPEKKPSPEPVLNEPEEEKRPGETPAKPGKYQSKRLGMDYDVLESGRVLVRKVYPNESADQAGLRSGDCIFYIDGVDLAGLNLEKLPLPRYVRFTIFNFKDRKWRELDYLVIDNLRRGIVGNPAMIIPEIGLGVEATSMGTIRVLSVEENSISERMGLRRDDIILEINGKSTRNRYGNLGPFDMPFTLKVRRYFSTRKFAWGAG